MYALLIALALIGADSKKKPDPLPKRTRQLIVVNASELEAANTAAIKVWGQAGKNTFTVQFNDGKNKGKSKEATHYVCSMAVTEAELAAFNKALESLLNSGKVVVHAKAIASKLNELKLVPVKDIKE